jgi:hypothetical protein
MSKVYSGVLLHDWLVPLRCLILYILAIISVTSIGWRYYLINSTYLLTSTKI